MTGQQLRNSILQEAIYGRLVPNVLQPGEKTGDDLLKDILAERQKKENKEKGKKAKKLTLSTIEEEPWELPEGWCWCHIQDIAHTELGKMKDSEKNKGEMKPYLCTINVRESGIDLSTVKQMRFSKDDCEHYLLQKNDLLICEGGDCGRCSIWDYDMEMYYQNSLHCVRFEKGLLPLFFKYILDLFKYQGKCNGQGVGIKHFTQTLLRGLCFPLPPLSIQKAIVDKIEELLPLIDEYDKAAVELETLNKILPDKLRKSVLQEAIHGTLVPNDIPEGEATGAELLQQILKERQEKEDKEKAKKAKKLTLSTIDEEPWELPDGWCWTRLGDVMTFVNGRAYKKEELLSSGKYKVLRVGNFFTNDSWYYSDLELPDEKYCFKGDLLYAWSASFGPWIWEGDKTIFHYHIWNVKFNEDKLYKKYLYWFFEADKHIIKESTTGSTMVHVSMENMMPRLIPIPPLSIQHRIVEKIEEVFSAINKLQA